jgi:hypothetical protein
MIRSFKNKGVTDDSLSIEQLEGIIFDISEVNSDILEECYHFVKIPVGQLTPEQISRLISQDIGLNFLIPKALKILREDVLTKILYTGDFLITILGIEPSYWTSNMEDKKEILSIVNKNMDIIKEIDRQRPFLDLVETIHNLMKDMEV